MSRFTQLSFSFSGLFCQNVTAMRLSALKSACGFFETLCRTAISFNFWHLFAPIKIVSFLEI